MGPSGLEPPTSRLSVVRSSQLSYGPILDFSHYGCFLSKERNGGDKRDRTVDPLLAKQVLSQLSYTPIFRRPAPSKLNNVSYFTLHQTSDLGIKRSCSFLSRTPVRTRPKPSDSGMTHPDHFVVFLGLLPSLRSYSAAHYGLALLSP